MDPGFAARLRDLRDRNGWTVADMAERTGIPKQTLDKYLLRQNPSLPGFDALVALSKGLGVSLDWLVLGSAAISEATELLVRRCADEVAQLHFETILREHLAGERPVFDGERILTLTPEEWSASLAYRAGERARELTAQGVTREELLLWDQKRTDRLIEITNDRFAKHTISAGSKPSASPARR
jgi:transcriptional regulator with XRE-family HTH domain